MQEAIYLDLLQGTRQIMDTFIDGLNSSMPNIPDSGQLVLLGDFNVSYSESKGREKLKLARVVALHNLE